MIRLALLTVIVLMLVSKASASPATWRGQTATISGTPIVLTFRGVPANAWVYAWVNGHRMFGVVKAGDVYLVGTSSVVQCPVRSGPVLTCRAARTVPARAQLRLVFSWRPTPRHAHSSSPLRPALPARHTNLGRDQLRRFGAQCVRLGASQWICPETWRP